jgi:3-deoxy-7-phosphoheptulonate synthase
VLDPLNEPGRVTLITRYGSKKIRQYLPAHIKAVQAAGLKVGGWVRAKHVPFTP